jgi:hypothetical protein
MEKNNIKHFNSQLNHFNCLKLIAQYQEVKL